MSNDKNALDNIYIEREGDGLRKGHLEMRKENMEDK